jgi:ABC-type lipoprotein export system ATPase subunit
MSMSQISTVDLYLQDGKRIHVKLPRGLCVLQGPNGCGKTQLLNFVINITNATTAILEGAVSDTNPRPLQPFVHRGLVSFENGLTIGYEQPERNADPESTASFFIEGNGNQARFTCLSRAEAGRRRFVRIEQQATPPIPSELLELSKQTVLHHGLRTLINTQRLERKIRPKHSWQSHFDGVLFHNKEADEFAKSMLKKATNEDLDPRKPVPQVQLTSAKVGYAYQDLRREHESARARRDDGTIQILLRDRIEDSDNAEDLKAQAIDESQLMATELENLGINDLEEFITAGAKRNFPKYPAFAAAYFGRSLHEIRQLRKKFNPLVEFFRIANGLLGKTRLVICSQDEIRPVQGPNHPTEAPFVVALRLANGTLLPLTAASSGQQNLIVLLANLLTTDQVSQHDGPPRRLFAIDEPEISLHLAWEQELMRQLENMSFSGEYQILTATHSNVIAGACRASARVYLT